MDKEEEKIKIIKLLTITGIIILVILFGALIYNVFIKDGGSRSSNKYLILGNYLILQKTNFGYKQITEPDDKLLNNKFTITNGTNTNQNVSMQLLNNNWYFFDQDYNEIDMPDFRMATNGLNIKLADFEKEMVMDPLEDEYAYKFLNDNNIGNKETYRVVKTTYDFDSDGEDEYIYTLSNNSLEAVDYKIHNYMFMVKNDKIITNEDKDNKAFSVMEILDLNNDGKYEAIINKGSIDVKTFNSCYQIYDLTKSSWKLKQDCK